MSKIITITIDENADQTVELSGYEGKGCAAVAQAFADAIGTATEVKHKPEYFKQTKTNLLKR